ncbi:rod shape-determining protein RodA [Desulforhopalus vacuolatus]|uniref:rod shape-determining protein RodA n=1 Tax=Desulforhopalus vacuolatus TaxID=40414 RepID=UPI0019652386|nr:rod shape-determining protein RodA [Desulforhopalus vacuolatus]MBM9518362.1 rod shape-determining protein RodA [Desulforhopalus vacuolatus]
MYRIDRRLLEHFDVILMLLIVLVCGMALFNLYSASMPSPGYSLAPWMKQSIIMAGCFLLFFVIISFDYKLLHVLNYPFYFFIIAFLLIADAIGATAGGAQRWINLGLFNFQPSEPAKLMIVITLASYYARKEVSGGYSFLDILPPLGLMMVPFILILIQPDLGTSLMLIIIFASMTMFVKLRWSAYVILLSLGSGAGIFAWFHLLKPYQKKRVETFLNPEHDLANQGYQILQSKIAVGSGGLTGNGYLKGTQGHLHFLPERHTDFACSILAEEWGFIGCLIFLLIYFGMLFWGLYVGMTSKDRFGTLLAFGVVTLIFWQAVINLFMIMGFLPVVGIPLPLVSYGGSSLITTMMGLAILMNVRMRRFNPMTGKNH